MSGDWPTVHISHNYVQQDREVLQCRGPAHDLCQLAHSAAPADAGQGCGCSGDAEGHSRLANYADHVAEHAAEYAVET